jgi:hypothetical protein
MKFRQPLSKIPWKIPWNSIEFHGKYHEKNPPNVYKKFHGIPWEIP